IRPRAFRAGRSLTPRVKNVPVASRRSGALDKSAPDRRCRTAVRGLIKRPLEAARMTQSPITQVKPDVARRLEALIRELPPPPDVTHFTVRSHGCGRRKPRALLVDAERGTTSKAAAILGLKPRKLQMMTKRGAIPGAAKLGRQWTFDLARLRRFVEQQEQACQNEKLRPDAIGAVEFSGVKFRLKGSVLGGRLGQMIQQSQRRVGRRAKSGR